MELFLGLIFATFFFAFCWGLYQVSKIRARPIFPNVSDEILDANFKSGAGFSASKRILYSVPATGFFLGFVFENMVFRIVLGATLTGQILLYLFFFAKACIKLDEELR